MAAATSPRLAGNAQYFAGKLGTLGEGVGQMATPALSTPATFGLDRMGAAQNNTQYAKGGKVTKPTHEFLVNRLMALAEKAKRDEKRATKPILNLPDDTVTHALRVAQAAI
jgi:hypothetical protein